MSAVLGANIAAGVSAGSHLCAIFSTDVERDDLLRDYFQERQDEFLLFVGGAAAAPLPADLRGHVEVRDGDGLYLADGGFDGQRVIDELRRTIADARRDGYRRLRVAGDMSWAPASGTDPAALLGYEARVNPLYTDGMAAGMCLYDDRRFPTQQLDELVAVHPFVTGTGEDGRARTFTASLGSDGTLWLRGEIDYFGVSHLVALLDDLANAHSDMVIDVSEVRFMDAAALHALDDAASRLRGTRRVILRSPSRVVSRLLALLPGTGAARLVSTPDPGPLTH